MPEPSSTEKDSISDFDESKFTVTYKQLIMFNVREQHVSKRTSLAQDNQFPFKPQHRTYEKVS